MPRQPTGTIGTVALRDGTRAFHLRFSALGKRQRVVLHERPRYECGCGGGWTARSARQELGNIAARVRAGVWTPPEPAPKSAAAPAMPTFHEYASAWLRGKAQGVLGEKRPRDAPHARPGCEARRGGPAPERDRARDRPRQVDRHVPPAEPRRGERRALPRPARDRRDAGSRRRDVSELCDIRLCDVRLHDRDGARVRIPDAKTEAGIRVVQLTPDLIASVPRLIHAKYAVVQTPPPQQRQRPSQNRHTHHCTIGAKTPAPTQRRGLRDAPQPHVRPDDVVLAPST
jgi:hypothetical protein